MKTKNSNPLVSTIVKALHLLLLVTFAVTSQAAVESTTYIITDHLGSPILATDEDGQVKWQEDYQPFGTQLVREDADNTVGFTGHRDDKALDVTYMQGRWYHPEMGRFMAIDPVGFVEGSPQSFNRYAYVSNNPYKYVDPDGKWQMTAVMGPPAPFGSGAEGMDRAIQAQKAASEGVIIGGTIGASLLFPPLAVFLEFDALTKGEPVPPIVSRSLGPVVNPTVAELRMLGQAGYQAHHILPEYLGKMLGYTSKEMANHPGTLVTQWTHTGKLNPDAFHKAISKHLPPMVGGHKASYSADQIRVGLENAYGELGRSELFNSIKHLIK